MHDHVPSSPKPWELRDRTFSLYRGNFTLFVGIAAVAYLPLFVIRTGAGLAQISSLKALRPGVGVTVIVTALLTLIFYLASVAAAQAATVTAVSSVYLGNSTTVGSAYGRVRGMIVRVVLVMIGMGIGIGIGLVLLIVPGIILTLMWALLISPQNRRIGDYVAGTIVVHEAKSEQIQPDWNSARASQPVEGAEAYLKLGDDDLAVIETYLRRRWELAPLVRVNTAIRICERLQQKARLAREGGQTDDDFLESVARKMRDQALPCAIVCSRK